MKINSIIITFASFLCACQNKKVNTYENNLGIVPEHLAQMDTVNFTIIEFADSVKTFGKVKSGAPVLSKYKFRNAGKTVLYISSVYGNCGCTVADYPKQPIMPGEEGFITVTFNTKDHPAYNRKTITVTSNTSNGTTHLLYLTGEVE
jgi:hypothetical protein